MQNLFNLVVEAAPNAMVLASDSGRIVYVNAQTESLFGYSRDELLGQSIELLVPERFRRAHPALRSEYTQAPTVRPMGAGRDLYGRCKDGSEIPIEIALNPLVTEDGNFVLAAIVNIAERKRMEELRLLNTGMQQHSAKLEVLNRELEASSRFKSQFVATMSHELRTPLNAIIGMTELLAKTKLDKRQSTQVETINESAEALLAIINSILDFSKIEAGKMDLRASTFVVETVVEAAADVLALQARDKGIVLHTYVDPMIPQVRGDADRLRQILLNLISNAVKFTERGQVVVRALPLGTPGRYVMLRFEVQDTGIGIPADVVPQLFQPFVQGDGSSSRRFGGTGLGLSISKRLAEL
ncbi:MAG TPA: histidine kinase dimerization/phospho-acceptor domain-containing protein, partial [Candidatus Binatia bacterium]|nr:histidine kinase dimerization/phospho-acceptor domain-containing protein [Candidatus Binatia bacterium]